MATTKVMTVLKNAQTILLDKTGTRWPLPELLNWYNAAQLAIVNHRPDALSKNVPFACALGTLQVLPAEALRLLDVPRNESGNKKPIRLIAREILDDQNPDWHSEAAPKSQVDHFVYDDRNPKNFWVYPCPAATTSIRVVYSVAPVEVAIANFDTDVQVMTLDDIYVNPLMDYILYRAYSKDAEYAGNANRATMHYESFNTALGIKTQVDQVMSPSARLSQ